MNVADQPYQPCHYYFQYLRPCGNWRCAQCAPLLQRQWRNRVEIKAWEHVDNGGKCRFITLTTPMEDNGDLVDLFKRFSVLRKSLNRCGGFGSWARGIGLGRANKPHIHLLELETGRLPEDDLMQRANSAGFSTDNPAPISSVGCAKDDIRRVAAYLTREAIVVATTWNSLGGGQKARPIGISWND